jgi:hypothetical protein
MSPFSFFLGLALGLFIGLLIRILDLNTDKEKKP